MFGLSTHTSNVHKDQHYVATLTKGSQIEQRNMHLELECKRLQSDANAFQETNKKYRQLKIDYRELLETFERSEAIRTEQK